MVTGLLLLWWMLNDMWSESEVVLWQGGVILIKTMCAFFIVLLFMNSWFEMMFYTMNVWE